VPSSLDADMTIPRKYFYRGIPVQLRPISHHVRITTVSVNRGDVLAPN
jgi:hypothetical protein